MAPPSPSSSLDGQIGYESCTGCVLLPHFPQIWWSSSTTEPASCQPKHSLLRGYPRTSEPEDLDQYDHQTKRLAILSIILLLAAVMVTGCSDFPILFHLLQSALDTVGGEDRLGPDELSEFALRQIHK